MKQYIKSLGLDWLFRYYIKDQENLIKFFNTFYELETDDNLLSFVKEFRKLLEFNWELRPVKAPNIFMPVRRLARSASRSVRSSNSITRFNPIIKIMLPINAATTNRNRFPLSLNKG